MNTDLIAMSATDGLENWVKLTFDLMEQYDLHQIYHIDDFEPVVKLEKLPKRYYLSLCTLAEISLKLDAFYKHEQLLKTVGISTHRSYIEKENLDYAKNDIGRDLCLMELSLMCSGRTLVLYRADGRNLIKTKQSFWGKVTSLFKT